MKRTIARLSSYAALTNGGAQPFPTIAGENVFDSRVDDIGELTAKSRVPVIAVATDEDRRDYRSSRGAPTNVLINRTLGLRIQISMMGSLEGEDGKLVPDWPQTDAAIEAHLDLMEYQVEAAFRGFWPWAIWWRKMWNIDQIVSVPMFSETEAGIVRISQREITYSLSYVGADCLPKAKRSSDLPLNSAGQPVSPVGTLPDDLAAVFDYIAAHGAGDIQAAAAEMRATLEARTLPASPVYPPLDSVRVHWRDSPAPSGEQPRDTFEAETLEQ